MKMSEESDVTANLVMFFKIIIVLVFVYPLLHYTLLKSGDGEPAPQPANYTDPPVPEPPAPARRRAPPVEQPSCPPFQPRGILRELCEDLVVRREQCTPEDFHDLEKHKLPRPQARNDTKGEPRGTIVGCVAAGLLLTSLGAAFVELYRAKSQTTVKTTKPPMSRKCSLADLTVLKHNRKELVRRESIMEIPESGGSIKQLGFRPPPLYRRCSFPAGPSEFCGNSYLQDSRRTSVDCRRLSIIDSRRSSMSVDSRKASIDARRVSIDNESPERRHWSRLVHRH